MVSLDCFAAGLPDRQEDPVLGYCYVCDREVCHGDEEVDGLAVVHRGECWRRYRLAQEEDRFESGVIHSMHRDRLEMGRRFAEG